MSPCVPVLWLFTIALAQVPTLTVRGHITDWFGESLPGVTVTVDAYKKGKLGSATTDEGGRYELIVPVELGLRIKAELGGFAVASDRLIADGDTVVWNQGLRLSGLADTRPSRIRGRVTDNGRPASGVNITLQNAFAQEVVAFATSDQLGRFEFGNLRQGGLYVITAADQLRFAAFPHLLNNHSPESVDIELRLSPVTP